MDQQSGSSFMELALEQARQAAHLGEVPIGAVVVSSSGDVIARAHNETLLRQDPTAHAEILALQRARVALDVMYLDDYRLYVTLEPCTMCAGAIAQSRLGALYYGAADPKGGAVEYGARFFSLPTCHHHLDIYDGLCATQSSQLLKDFFAERR